MKKMKVSWRLPVLAVVVVGLAFLSAGCASILDGLTGSKIVETVQSKKFLDGANDILTQNTGGYPLSQFKVLFERKFPGVNWDTKDMVPGAEITPFIYNGKNYRLFTSVIPRIVGNQRYNYWVSATKCVDITPKPKTE